MFPIFMNLQAILDRQKSKDPNSAYSYDADMAYGWDWGWRLHPTLGEKKWHNGVDLPTSQGTPILAPWDGIVSVIGKDDTSGNYIKLSHDPSSSQGVKETAYCHLYDVEVYEGEIVKAGTVIGQVGSTGRSTGPHLHFIVRTPDGSIVGGTHHRDVDPLPYLEESLKKKLQGAGIVGSMLIASSLLYWYLVKR